MKYNKTVPNDRKRVCEAHEEGRDWKAVAQALGIKLRTAYMWLQNGQFEAKKKGGSESKKTDEIVSFLTDQIEKEPSVTLQQLADMLRNRFEIVVCIATVKNWLDGELFSLKAVRPLIQNVNREENKIKRAEYLEAFFHSRSNGRTMIWIDESNFNLFCRRNEGRSKIGTRAAIVLPSCKGANLHCIGAMSDSRIVHFTTRRGAFKADDCNQWLEDLLEACANQGIDQPTLIVDNAPAHARLERVLEHHENVQILRLAPYSYLLNPIELLWSVFKSHIKQGLRQNMEELAQMQRHGNVGIAEQRMMFLENLAMESIRRINGRMLAGFVSHVEKYYPAVMRQEDLKEE